MRFHIAQTDHLTGTSAHEHGMTGTVGIDLLNDIQIDELECNVEICVVYDDAMFYDAIIGLNVLMQGQTIINENGVTFENKSKCTEEAATLSVLPINLSPEDFEINTAPDIRQIYELKDKTITPNLMPGK
ncbi:CCHC-type domain-containing protein [Trichonephila clavipes]|nr:CCHC-type domain-containing protein [Trichonephila clavipes]